MTDYIQHDVKYLPIPNQVAAVLSNVPAPAELTSTAFVFPILRDRRLVMAQNTRRGLEIPGGHVEHGETLEQAALREALEEAGCEFQRIVPLGFLQMTTKGAKPDGYKYPYPASYQQFFAGVVEQQVPFAVTDECFEPVAVPVEDLPKLLTPGMLAFYNQAIVLLGL